MCPRPRFSFESSVFCTGVSHPTIVLNFMYLTPALTVTKAGTIIKYFESWPLSLPQ